VILRFDGIDTLGDIYLNDVYLGKTVNMHRTWEFDVTSVLKDGNNLLRVLLHSPFKAADEAFAKCPTKGSPMHGRDSAISERPTICTAGTGAHTCRMRESSAMSLCL